MTKEKEEIKVVDKRRFDSKGDPKEDDEKSTAETEKGCIPESDAGSGESGNEASAGDESLLPITFSSFIMSLATQAMMQLGEIAPPEGLDIKPDIKGVQQTIDIIDMLNEKTKGNLDDSEAHLMEEILHSLRMRYVQSKKGGVEE